MKGFCLVLGVKSLRSGVYFILNQYWTSHISSTSMPHILEATVIDSTNTEVLGVMEKLLTKAWISA